MKLSKILFLLLFLTTVVFSQSKIKISYNESIQLKRLNKNIHIHIIGNSVNTHLKGNEINKYVFKKPGNYLLKIVDKTEYEGGDADDHTALPDEITVEVSRVKMTFDSSHIILSEPIRKNRDTANITMTIPVTVETYDQRPILFHSTPVNSAGIGTNIVANLKNNDQELNNGTHLLSYSLKGSVTQNAYLMFDFIDANNTIHSISLATPIKD